MNHTRTAFVAVDLDGTGGEYSILEKEGLIPRDPLLDDVTFPGFILLSLAFLMEESVKFSFSLLGEIMIQEFVSISNVRFHQEFRGVDSPGELVRRVVRELVAFKVFFAKGEDVHAGVVGLEYYPTTLAFVPFMTDPNFLASLVADDDPRGAAVLRSTRSVSDKLFTFKVLDYCKVAIVGLGDVPGVGGVVGNTLTIQITAGQVELSVSIRNSVTFNVKADFLDEDLVVVGDDLRHRVVGLMVEGGTSASDLVGAIGRESGLDERSAFS